jgi:hypothetical protein
LAAPTNNNTMPGRKRARQLGDEAEQETDDVARQGLYAGGPG